MRKHHVYKYRIKLDNYQIRTMIGALLEYRRAQLEQKADTNAVNHLLLKVMDVYEMKS